MAFHVTRPYLLSPYLRHKLSITAPFMTCMLIVNFNYLISMHCKFVSEQSVWFQKTIEALDFLLELLESYEVNARLQICDASILDI